jgi:hypothetical protein
VRLQVLGNLKKSISSGFDTSSLVTDAGRYVTTIKLLNSIRCIFPLFLQQWEILTPLYRMYQNSTAKLEERTPHIETRNKVYDNMGLEMHTYRVIRPFSNVSAI